MTKRLLANAFHEAGHAVVAYLLRRRIVSVSVQGHDCVTVLSYVNGKSQWRIEQKILIALAGPVAECYFTGRRQSPGCQMDAAQAFIYASFISGSNRMPAFAPDPTDPEVMALIRRLRERVSDLITADHDWRAVESLAAALLKKTSLTGEEARKVIRSGLHPKRAKKSARDKP
jgi:ATP-dependent Zn protease